MMVHFDSNIPFPLINHVFLDCQFLELWLQSFLTWGDLEKDQTDHRSTPVFLQTCLNIFKWTEWVLWKEKSHQKVDGGDWGVNERSLITQCWDGVLQEDGRFFV